MWLACFGVRVFVLILYCFIPFRCHSPVLLYVLVWFLFAPNDLFQVWCAFNGVGRWRLHREERSQMLGVSSNVTNVTSPQCIVFIFVCSDTKLRAVWGLNPSTTYLKPPIMTFTLKRATCCILSTQTLFQTETRQKACTLVCRMFLKTSERYKVRRAFKSVPAIHSI